MDNTVLPHPELVFLASRSRPYYIVTAEWSQQSAGTRVTFQLCHILNELGYEAYMVAQKSAPGLRTPLLTPEIKARHKEQGRKTIGVYTDMMWGNTLETDVVVKWMTNREGIYSNSKHDDDALYFYFSPLYSKSTDVNILCCMSIDQSVFNDLGVDDSKREGFAYFAHKYLREGKGKISEKLTSKGISLCKDIPRSKEEIADILRRVKTLYVYEDTALYGEAALCGCIPVIVKTDFVNDYLKHYKQEHILLSEDEIDTDAEITVSYSLKEHVLSTYIDAHSQLSNFVNITQKASLGYNRTDPLLNYCREHERVFLYGNGIIGSMFFNAISTASIKIESFIISDEQVDAEGRSSFGIPVRSFDWLSINHNSICGVVLAMTNANREQVIPMLKEYDIDYF